jgi:hypothetical protein
MKAALLFLMENNLLNIYTIKKDEIDQKYMAYKAWCIDRNTYPYDSEEFAGTLSAIGVVNHVGHEDVAIESQIGIENSGEMIQHSVLAFLASDGIILSKSINTSEAESLLQHYREGYLSDDMEIPIRVLMIYMYKFGIIKIKILLDFINKA